jgi:GNAT superfamily N-acetyltransferase
MASADAARVSPEAGGRAPVLAFLRRTVEMTAAEMRRIDAGWVARTPSLRLVRAINHVRVERDVTYAQALELTQEHLEDLPYRQLVVEDATGEGLEDAFRAGGWKVERHLLMTLARDPDREVDTAAVIDAPESETLALMARWLSEAMTLSSTELQQLLDCTAREGAARGERRLGVRGDDGALVAMAKLRSDARTAQVEDVYVLPAARGRGFGRMLVTRATELARAAGHELVFIVADDDGWPKQLYARIGFEPIGRMRVFHRRGAG